MGPDLGRRLPSDQFDAEASGLLLIQPLPVQHLTELGQASAAKLVSLLPGGEGLDRHVKPAGQPGLTLVKSLKVAAQYSPELRPTARSGHDFDSPACCA